MDQEENPDETERKRRRRRKPIKQSGSSSMQALSSPSPVKDLSHQNNQSEVKTPPEKTERKIRAKPEKPKRRRANRKNEKKSPTPIVAALHALAADVHETMEVSTNRHHPSLPRSRVPPSQIVSKVYVERPKSFVVLQEGDGNMPHFEKDNVHIMRRNGPVEFALASQRSWHVFATFCCGMLAGLAFWQCIMAHALWRVKANSFRDFADYYSVMARPLQTVFFFLCAVSTMGALERYNVGHSFWKLIQRSLALQSGGIVVLIYFFALIVTLSAAPLDDKMAHFALNSTFWDQNKVMEADLYKWRALNLARCLAVILGWMLMSLHPGTDLLHKHIAKFSEFTEGIHHP